MFWKFDDSLKIWKKDLKASGADMSVVKNWQKAYDKVKSQAPQMESQYIQVKQNLQTVYALLQNMEEVLISCKIDGIALSEPEMAIKIRNFSSEMKKFQESFHHEFFVSSQDTDFHLTYKTIVAICDSNDKNALILQSEVENLLAISKEALEKEWPSFRAIAFYYLERSDKEIFDLPHADKVDKAVRVYENEFLKPIRQIFINCYGEDKARQILEVDLWK